MCALRRLKSSCASVQSDLSLRCPHEEDLHSGLSKNAHSEDSDQPAQMIWIFACRTYSMVRFMTLRFILFCFVNWHFPHTIMLVIRNWSASSLHSIWTATSENVPPGMRFQHSRSLIRIFNGRILDSQGYKVSSCGKRRFWPVCAHAQADLRLR